MSVEERQQDEIKSIESIYGDIYTNLTPKELVWNKKPSPHFQIFLESSLYSDHPTISLIIDIEFTPTYPNSSPMVKLLNPKNILKGRLQRLQNKVDDILKEYLGDEVSFVIISEIKEMLDDFQMTTEKVLSLEEEREQRIKNIRLQLEEEENRKERERTLARQKQDAELNEQILKIRGEYYEEGPDDDNQITEDDLLIPEDKDNYFIFTNTMVGTTRNAKRFRFKAVSGFTPCENKGPLSSISTAKIVTPYLDQETWARIGQDVSFQLVEIPVDNPYWITENGKKEIQDLESQLQKIVGLVHDTIYGLVGFQIDETKDSNHWRVRLLFDNVQLETIQELLKSGPISPTLARSWLIQLLPSLEYLHNLGIPNKLINLGGVFLCHGKLKLGHTDYGYTLLNMMKRYPNRNNLNITLQSNWSAPEFSETGPTLKTDIWDLGVLFLKIIYGKDVFEKYPTPKEFHTSFLSDNPDSENIYELLNRMLQNKSSKRPSPMELNAAKFLRYGLGDTLVATNPKKQITSTAYYDPSFSGSSVGRYERDFEEIQKLGKGGFGEVFKVRNRMEGTFYAIKKIKYKAHKLDSLLSEVLSLARLNHQYIVRYYGTWVEEAKKLREENSETTDDSTFDDDDLDYNRNSDISDDPFTFSTRNSSFMASMDNSFQIDFISNDPQIEFGYSSDEDSDDSEESTDQESRSVSNESDIVSLKREMDQTPQILYIQMEFCENNTLQNLIEQGLPDNPNEYWRLFRQLLEAVSYIHREGFIHRDLKPMNIFIDKDNNIKVGDFGLAKNSQFASVVSTNNQVEPANKDWSTVVGTVFYTANEVATGDYDEKVDMYSLGIIFFEMCHTMGTGMERAHTLNGLRLPSVEFPTGWRQQNVQQKRIIKLLLDHDSKKRPGASELLQSGWLPVEHQDQIIKEALRSLADPASPWQQQVRETLFQQPYVLARDLMYDVEDPRSFKATAEDYMVCDQMVQELTKIFRNHGALEDFKTNKILPKSPFNAGDNVFEVLDKSGSILQLPYDLTLPCARYLSKTKVPFEKSFKHDVVYRPGRRPGGKPESYQALTFDICTNEASKKILHDAECLVVLDEIFRRFPSKSGSQFILIINHVDIINAVINFSFDHVGIDDRQRAEVMGILSQLGIEKDPDEIRRLLREARVPHTITKELIDRFNFLIEPELALNKMQKAMMDSPQFIRVERAMEYIHSVLQFFKELGGKTKVLFSPLVNYNTKYYRGGIMFQAVHSSKSRRKARIASGGRYDALIETLANRDITKLTTWYSVGFQLSSTFLFILLKKGLCQFEQKGRCMVIVGSTNVKYVHAGCEVIQNLWKSNISADMNIPALSQEDIFDRAKNEEVNYVVLIKDANITSKKHKKGFKPLKVKNLISNKEYDVEYDELVSTILKEEDISSSTESIDFLTKNRHQNDEDIILGPLSEINLSQRIYAVPNAAPRGRKNKKDLWENENDAQIAGSTLVKSLAQGPVISIDVREEVLSMISLTSLKSQDEWIRKVVYSTSNLPMNFAINIYNTLTKEANRGTKWAILYSSKANLTTIMDLQKI